MTYNQIVEHYGGLSKAAQALGYTRQRVNAWKRIRIPSDVQLKIAALSGLKADRKAHNDVAELSALARRAA